MPVDRYRAKWIGPMTIVCYLDDSGSGLDRPIVTLAGYIARLDEWMAFEPKGRAYLDGNGVGVLHAVDLNQGRGDFKDWSVDRKLGFVRGLYDLFSPHALLGISGSAVHAQHKAKKALTGLSINQSAYGFCFNWILNRLLTDREIPPDDQLQFVVEEGSKNNSGLAESYYNIKKQHNIDRLTGISFVSKESCVAIQMADMIAYYSRRHGERVEQNNGLPVEMEPVLSSMMEKVSVISCLATDFLGLED